MEGNIERDCSALGGLFQQIISDMKVGMGWFYTILYLLLYFGGIDLY